MNLQWHNKHYSMGGGGEKKTRLRSITIAWLKMKTQIIIIIFIYF